MKTSTWQPNQVTWSESISGTSSISNRTRIVNTIFWRSATVLMATPSYWAATVAIPFLRTSTRPNNSCGCGSARTTISSTRVSRRSIDSFLCLVNQISLFPIAHINLIFYDRLLAVEKTPLDQGACRFYMTGLDGTFGRADIPEEMFAHSKDHEVPLDCTWVITVAETHKVNTTILAPTCSFRKIWINIFYWKDSTELPELRTDVAQRVRFEFHRNLRWENGLASSTAPFLRLENRYCPL